MGRLIEQFCAASRKWADHTGESDDNIIFYTMFRTGGASQLDPIGHLDATSFLEEHLPGLTPGAGTGRYTPDQMKAWLKQLVSEIGVEEEFLITSLIRWIDRELEDLLENYAKGLRNQRAIAEELELLASDPDKLQRYLNQPGAPHSKGALRALIERLRNPTTPSLEDQRRRRVALDAWRTLTHPILEAENLDKFRDESVEHG